MKTKRMVPLLAGLLMIGGCASTKSPTTHRDDSSYYDRDYIGAVNSLARRAGTRVIWVNPPRETVRKKHGE